MSELPRKFQGVWIPAALWLDRSLSITEKVMLVEISSLESPHRGCYATNAHFAEFFNLSVSRVSEIISGLAERHIIGVEQIREGKRIVERRIRVFGSFEKPNTPSENTANPFGKGGEPPSEKAQGSNTSMSNTLNNTYVPFDAFWKLYPKKVDKAQSEKIWNKLKVTPELFEIIREALVRRCQSLDWKKSNGQFVPNPTTWLNRKRWQDEISDAVGAQSRHTGLNEIDHTSGLVLGEDGHYRVGSF